MTFNEIEKEFDEYCLSASHTLGESLASVQVYNHRKSDALMLKSFLKQSFIKYLQSEVERLEKSKKEKPSDKAYVYTGIEVDRYNQAISGQITHLQAQVKELES